MPTYADLFEQAVRLQANPETLDDAIHLMNQVLNADERQDVVLFHLATAFMQKDWNGLAIRLFQACPSMDRRPEYWNNMGVAYRNEHRLKEAERCWLKAMEIEQRPEYFSNLAILHVNEGRPEKGIPFAREAVKRDPNNPKNAWNLSLLLLEAGELDEGFDYYDAGIASGDRLAKDYGCSTWNGEDLTGKRIVVHGEQGLGDEIMAMSLLDELDAHITYDCHPRLESVAKQSFPGIEVVPYRKEGTEWAQGKRFDYQIPILSLFRRYRPKRRPYLVPDPEKVKEIRELLKDIPRPWIGIGWAGGAKRTNAHHRSFKLSQLKPILDLPASFVSLQYSAGAYEKLERHYQKVQQMSDNE